MDGNDDEPAIFLRYTLFSDQPMRPWLKTTESPRIGSFGEVN